MIETPKELSLDCSWAEMMVMKLVVKMESDWVELMEMYSDNL